MIKRRVRGISNSVSYLERYRSTFSRVMDFTEMCEIIPVELLHFFLISFLCLMNAEY
jgi:hypothetical protein